MFTQSFNNYACINDSIECEIDGVTYTATIEHDHDYHIDDDECHSTDQSVTGCNDVQFKKLLEARESWNNGEWSYCGIVLSAVNSGGWKKDHLASLWGIECNYPGSKDNTNDHLKDIANELLAELL